MSKVCNIDSGNIVNGSRLFYISTLAEWNSPLDKLENGYEMFLRANGRNDEHDGFYFRCSSGAAEDGGYCNFASLTSGQKMFAESNPLFVGFIVNFPELKNGSEMFERANIGNGAIGQSTAGRLWITMPKLENGEKMFYLSKADVIYLNLAGNAGEVNLNKAFAGADFACGVEIDGCERFSNTEAMFQDFGQGGYMDVSFRYSPLTYPYLATANSMFSNASLGCLHVVHKSNSRLGFYNGYYYSSDYHTNLGDEGFFTNLSSMIDLVSANSMFYNVKKETDQNKSVFDIIETEISLSPWHNLRDTSFMFHNAPVGYLTLTNDLFVGHYQGLSSECMFDGAIKYDKIGGTVNVTFGGNAFAYCNNANSMFKNCDGIEKFVVYGRNGLCSDGTRMNLGAFPSGDYMFAGCSHLYTFETRTDNNSQIEYGYHLISSGVGCFSGCRLNSETSLRCAYNFLSACADSTIGLSKTWANSAEGENAMYNMLGITYPTLSVTHHGGNILRFEYN